MATAKERLDGKKKQKMPTTGRNKVGTGPAAKELARKKKGMKDK